MKVDASAEVDLEKHHKKNKEKKKHHSHKKHHHHKKDKKEEEADDEDNEDDKDTKVQTNSTSGLISDETSKLLAEANEALSGKDEKDAKSDEKTHPQA